MSIGFLLDQLGSIGRMASDTSTRAFDRSFHRVNVGVYGSEARHVFLLFQVIDSLTAVFRTLLSPLPLFSQCLTSLP